jgi:hypothetical protein
MAATQGCSGASTISPSTIPMITDTIEHTGDIGDCPELAPAKEGEDDSNDEADDDGDDDDASVASFSNKVADTDDSSLFKTPAPSPVDEPLHILDNRNKIYTAANPHCSACVPVPNKRYLPNAHVANLIAWADSCFAQDKDMAEACSAEAHAATLPNAQDAYSWEPAPKTIRDIIKMPEGMVKTEWLTSVKKELKTLVDSGTFVIENMEKGKSSTPIMEIFKVKILRDGSLDKLKTRLVVRGDLHSKSLQEDKWSPMFLAHEACLKSRVKQLDFIDAFLQANTQSRIFVPIPALFGNLFPEFKEYCGRPIR